MTQTFSSPQVVCRPALARDVTDVTEFCKGIWEGGDYVPQVWRDWFKDPNGFLMTAEYQGRAIGCAKISLLAGGQWWLEGFRVDPNFQGLKVGSRIHNYLSDWWVEHGDGTLRLMTDAGNFAVHHLCSKTGFVKTHEVCAYKATPIAEPTGSFSPVTDLQDAAAFAIQAESIQASDGLTDFGWQIGRPDEQIFEAYANDSAGFAHSFYWWKAKQGLFSAWMDEDDEKRTLVIGVVACALNDVPALLTDIRKFAGGQKCDSVFKIAFDLPQIVSRLEAGGFWKHWKRSNAFVFQKWHSSST